MGNNPMIGATAAVAALIAQALTKQLKKTDFLKNQPFSLQFFYFWNQNLIASSKCFDHEASLCSAFKSIRRVKWFLSSPFDL